MITVQSRPADQFVRMIDDTAAISAISRSDLLRLIVMSYCGAKVPLPDPVRGAEDVPKQQ